METGYYFHEVYAARDYLDPLESKGEDEHSLLESKGDEFESKDDAAPLRSLLVPKGLALELLRSGVASRTLDFNDVIIIADNHWTPQEVRMAFGWIIEKNGTKLSLELISNDLQQAFDLLALLPVDP